MQMQKNGISVRKIKTVFLPMQVHPSIAAAMFLTSDVSNQ
jgi:hypothetical protein